MHRKAFTLIELIAVMVVIVILAYALIPRIGNMRAQAIRTYDEQTAITIGGAIETAITAGALTADTAPYVYPIVTTSNSPISQMPYLQNPITNISIVMPGTNWPSYTITITNHDGSTYVYTGSGIPETNTNLVAGVGGSAGAGGSGGGAGGAGGSGGSGGSSGNLENQIQNVCSFAGQWIHDNVLTATTWYPDSLTPGGAPDPTTLGLQLEIAYSGGIGYGGGKWAKYARSIDLQPSGAYEVIIGDAGAAWMPWWPGYIVDGQDLSGQTWTVPSAPYPSPSQVQSDLIAALQNAGYDLTGLTITVTDDYSGSGGFGEGNYYLNISAGDGSAPCSQEEANYSYNGGAIPG